MQKTGTTYLSNEETLWQIEVYRWLISIGGGWSAFRRQPLVLPTEECFPVSAGLPKGDLASTLFEQVKAHAGMSDWQTTLVPRWGTEPNLVSGQGMPGASRRSMTAGTFSLGRSGRGRITYSPHLLEDPTLFVAAMSHELAHFVMSNADSSFPGKHQELEMATDVCASFMGFGIFLANAAFTFSQSTGLIRSSWSAERLGYLDQRQLSLSLAIFLACHEIPVGSIARFLKPNPKSYTKKAVRFLERGFQSHLLDLRDA